jgi:hypothetical protein
MSFVTRIIFIVVLCIGGSTVIQRAANAQSSSAVNNPYRAVEPWEKLPPGMVFGALSGAFPDPDGQHIWMLSRCGENICADQPDVDPIFKFDLEGNLVDSFGAGLFGFPHGFYLDHEGFLWVTEGAPHGDERAEPGYARGIGHQVHKLNQRGEIVMSLGEAGVWGDDEHHFNGPADVLVDRSGNIWVVDGHRGGNNRLMKFAPDGRFLLQLGGGIDSRSREINKFDDPHGLAMDSQGLIYVADRGNNRIQIFDQNGNLVDIWTQFGKPSGLFIDRNDVLYSVDGLSGINRPDFRSNHGWEQGVRIGSIRDGGWVTEFIPNHGAGGGAGMEFLGVDFDGNIYVNDISRVRIAKYSRFR